MQPTFQLAIFSCTQTSISVSQRASPPWQLPSAWPSPQPSQSRTFRPFSSTPTSFRRSHGGIHVWEARQLKVSRPDSQSCKRWRNYGTLRTIESLSEVGLVWWCWSWHGSVALWYREGRPLPARMRRYRRTKCQSWCRSASHLWLTQEPSSIAYQLY